MQRSIPFLWILVIILLLLNLLVLDVLNLARLAAIDSLSRIEATLDRLANEVIVYNFEINRAVPMKADIPLNRTIEVPLHTSVPIDQVLTVPFQTPAGEVVLDVPVQAEVPISMVVPVDFDQTISVDTVVQLETTLPVEIKIAETPLAAYLRQAESEVARLKRRLSLKRGAATDDVVDESIPDSVSSADSTPDTSSDSASSTPPIEAEAVTSVAGPDPEPDVPEISQPTAASLSLSRDDANLGLCAHDYWPLWPGTSWTYNSRDTSYTQNVDDVSDNQALLSTQYEGRDIQARLLCSQEGLGGVYLGDMRRITELGDLNFSNPRGVFLPRSETMEEIGTSWRQELDVTGTVQASQDDAPLEGKISQGRAVAVYTPVGFETVETPLGPRDALRVEQRLDLELGINFDLEGQVIPATEVVNLNTVYWFAKDIGLVKMHWRGGTIQQDVEIGQAPVSQKSSVTALAEDQLVSVCVPLADQTVECAPKDGLSEAALGAPPQFELVVQSFVLPNVSGSDDSTSAVDTGDQEAPSRPADDAADGDDDARSELLAYAEAVESLGQQNSGAAEDFWESALKYQRDELTFDEFRAEFEGFAPRVRGVIQGLSQLSPPSQAGAIHQQLTDGMAKCDQALDLMDEWFDAPNDGTQQAAILLVTGCVEQVTAAGEELTAIVGEN